MGRTPPLQAPVIDKSAMPASLQHLFPSATTTDALLEHLVLDVTGTLAKTGYKEHGVVKPFDLQRREGGYDMCVDCWSMIGNNRLRMLILQLRELDQCGIPGDVFEAGAWKGGAGIVMLATEIATGKNRRVVLADSFQGLPLPSTPVDQAGWHHDKDFVAGLPLVRSGFQKYFGGAPNVEFVEGFFVKTLPGFRQGMLQRGAKLALLRIDADMYESYTDVLYNLYELVSVGGYVICDDCPIIDTAANAVTDFRARHGIVEPLVATPGSLAGLSWRKERDVVVDHQFYAQWNSQRAGR